MSSKSIISRVFTVAFGNKWQIVLLESKILYELTTLPVIPKTGCITQQSEWPYSTVL